MGRAAGGDKVPLQERAESIDARGESRSSVPGEVTASSGRLRLLDGRFSLGIADAYVGIAVLAVLVARFVPFVRIDGLAPCSFRAITGLPCPSCGFTRAFMRAANLDLEGALLVSPFGTALFASVAVFGILGVLRILLRMPWPRVEVGRAGWRLFGIAFALLLLTNWAYLLYRHLIVGDWA